MSAAFLEMAEESRDGHNGSSSISRGSEARVPTFSQSAFLASLALLAALSGISQVQWAEAPGSTERRETTRNLDLARLRVRSEIPASLACRSTTFASVGA